MSYTAAPHSVVDVPELLAPAGDMEAMRAAVANGADAVLHHVGGSVLNATEKE